MTLMANTFNMLISLGVSQNKCDKKHSTFYIFLWQYLFLFLGLSTIQCGNRIGWNETLDLHNKTVQYADNTV